MHARVEQLLSIRDGEPVEATVRAHVDSCGDCATAILQLDDVREQLVALPDVAAKPGAWEAVQARLAARGQSTRRRRVASRVAAAASLASLALFATLHHDGDGAARDPARAAAPLTAGDEVSALLDRSLDLERALAAMPSRPAVERAETSLPIDALEARVQWIDHQLSVADADGAPVQDAERLWRERVEVMSSLVRLRYVEAQRLAL
jgi:hypothetical protein